MMFSMNPSKASVYLHMVQAWPFYTTEGKTQEHLSYSTLSFWPQQAEKDPNRVFGNTVELPRLLGVPVIQWSAVMSPSEIGIRLNKGVRCLGPHLRIRLRGGASGILENCKSRGRGTLCAQSFSKSSSQEQVLYMLTQSNVLRLRVKTFYSLEKEEEGGSLLGYC